MNIHKKYKTADKSIKLLFGLFLIIEVLLIISIVFDNDRIFLLKFDLINGWKIFFKAFDLPIYILVVYLAIWTALSSLKKLKAKIKYCYDTFIIVSAIYISEKRVLSVAHNENYTIQGDIKQTGSYIRGSKMVRHRFWRATIPVLLIISILILILNITGNFTFSINNIFRIISVLLLSIASLARIPWRDEVSIASDSIILDVIYYQYFLSNLAATILLILALWL